MLYEVLVQKYLGIYSKHYGKKLKIAKFDPKNYRITSI